MQPKVISLVRCANGRSVRAVVEVEYAGILLRGLKLIYTQGHFSLSEAKHRTSTNWQRAYDILHPAVRERILYVVLRAYNLVRSEGRMSYSVQSESTAPV